MYLNSVKRPLLFLRIILVGSCMKGFVDADSFHIWPGASGRSYIRDSVRTTSILLWHKDGDALEDLA